MHQMMVWYFIPREIHVRAMSLGAPCDAATSCSDGLVCACVAYQRHLRVCQPPELHDDHERRGLSCERATHPSARIMSPPPLRAVAGVQAVASLPEVAAWARRYPFYADGWYTSILAGDGVGLPVLAGAATPRERVDFAQRVARKFLVDALREPATLLTSLLLLFLAADLSVHLYVLSRRLRSRR